MKSLLLTLGATLIATLPASAQYTAKEWPDGPMKQRFTEVCGACHDINRIRVGYTPEGWLTVVRMMQNFDTPVPATEWGAMQDYLIKNFPERTRPPAVIVDGPAKVNIRLWDVPTQGSRPHDPVAAKDGSIWWTGQLANKLGRIDPKTEHDPRIHAEEAALRSARPRRGQGRQHLVHRQRDRGDRQARSEDRHHDRIQIAGREGEGPAHDQHRPEGNRLVHGAAGQFRRQGRSEDRRGEARHARRRSARGRMGW